jgi:hypothetical protein
MKLIVSIAALLLLSLLELQAAAPAISGERRQWHKVTITWTGPEGSEAGAENPFTDYRLQVTFTHRSGGARYEVPGYFAADGKAAATSATAGNQWRVHFTPDRSGEWTWRVSMLRGAGVATNPDASATPVAGLDGDTGMLLVAASDKKGVDFRAKGRLQYVGEHYLRFAGNNEYFLKAGTDSPETLLGYADFDGTVAGKVPLKQYRTHIADWKAGDPTWQNGKGKGLIGALNYLAAKGLNSISFLTYNAAGDGDNIWPYVNAPHNSPAAKLRMDVSKLDQWQIVFDHAQSKGLYLHFKLQEQENDDNRLGGTAGTPANVPASLDGGALGPERRLYLRELIARFGYALAMNWNLGEENTQSAEEQRAMALYIRDNDPWKNHIVVHTFPNWQDRVYEKLVGEQSVLTGASLQMQWNEVHRRTLQWRQASESSGRKWIVANDEQGSADHGVPPDDGYQGFAGKDRQGKAVHSMHDIRKQTLWANLLAGGAGVEYYFGYQLVENDLLAEDFRSRDKSWDYCRIALAFFRTQKIPFWRMSGSAADSQGRYLFSASGEVYLLYMPVGGRAALDLPADASLYDVRWFNPRQGGPLQRGSIAQLRGGRNVDAGIPPADPAEDWLLLVRRK